MFRVLAAVCAAAFLFSAVPALAATTGVVRGTITSGGKPVAGANVVLESDGQAPMTTSSRGDGSFVFAQVPFGHYHLIASAAGAQRTVDVDVTSDALVSIALSLETVKQIANVGVTARAGVGGTPVSVNVLSHDTIAASPDRDSLNKLVTTMPGIVQFSYGEPVAHGFHGLTYEIDGAPLPQATSSEFAEIIDPKSIDSLEVLTGAFPAEYGGSRQGAVINIVTSRLSDLKPGSYGSFTFGGGEQATALGTFNERYRGQQYELDFTANAQRSDRGLDAPNFSALHDNASQSDQLLRGIFALNKQTTLSFDASNQLAQFQIPINTDPNNLYDPIVNAPATDDVQREYDRYFNLNLTRVSNDGLGVVQVVPWLRSTRVAYLGDLANDVLATAPDPDTGTPVNQAGLTQDRHASYAGIRTSYSRSSETHSYKVGLDLTREFFNATQTFACYTSDCTPTGSVPPPAVPGYYGFASSQSQNGAQLGAYIEDKWRAAPDVSISYGLRYDHSTGYTSGWQLSPRIGVNIGDGGRNILHAYYGRLYAAPQLEDVRQACVLLNGCSGEPTYNLQPERDAYAELGVAHTFSAHSHGYINIFRRSVVNVLDTTQFLNTPLFAVFNNAIGIDNGIEGRFETQAHNGNSFYISATVSGSYAGGVSGSTFLLPPNPPGVSLTDPSQLAPEDHDQTVAVSSGYTQRFGANRSFYATLETDYGTGYPVDFENASGLANGFALSGRLPVHTTLNLSLGRNAGLTARDGIGFSLDVQNVLGHQYLIKVANGFNTTQISNGRRALLRVTLPF